MENNVLEDNMSMGTNDTWYLSCDDVVFVIYYVHCGNCPIMIIMYIITQ